MNIICGFCNEAILLKEDKIYFCVGKRENGKRFTGMLNTDMSEFNKLDEIRSPIVAHNKICLHCLSGLAPLLDKLPKVNGILKNYSS